MSTLTICGDVHGKIDQYIDKVKNSDYSIQLGDMGFNYDSLRRLDSTRHKFFGGNHDNYDIISNFSHNLGDFGEYNLGRDVYFVRGAFSIDIKYRQAFYLANGRKIWWEQEQLRYGDFIRAACDYQKKQTKIMITHTCPSIVAKKIGNLEVLRNFGYSATNFTTVTQEGLQLIYETYAPKIWFFGHFHKDWYYRDNETGTHFICLGELSTANIDLYNGSFVFLNKEFLI